MASQPKLSKDASESLSADVAELRMSIDVLKAAVALQMFPQETKAGLLVFELLEKQLSGSPRHKRVLAAAKALQQWRKRSKRTGR